MWFRRVSTFVVSLLVSMIINPFRIHHNHHLQNHEPREIEDDLDHDLQHQQPQDDPSQSPIITSTESHSIRLRQPKEEVFTNSVPAQDPHPAMTIDPDEIPADAQAQQFEEDKELITATRSIPSYPQLPTYMDFYQFPGTDDQYSPSAGSPSPTLDDSPVHYWQIQRTTPLHAVVNPITGLASDHSSFSSPIISAIDPKTSPPGSPPTNYKASLNSIMMNSENSQSTEIIRASKEQKEKEDREDEEEHYHPMIQIIDEQQLGKHILVLAIPLMIGLMATYKADSISVCMLLVLFGLSFGFSAIWNGILLRKTFRKASVVILVTGIGLMLFAIFVFMGCFVPPGHIWVRGVLGVCWLSTLFALGKAILAVAFSGKNKIDDPEKGKNHT
ncbi:hypothetical protein O6P43_032848 [Quillaja saponaria]|uniref:Uncharacterized protein n=1 Tax=Quillaja saponaria TaxID=32244 RepID=A0AAD7KQV9_QUISA|nr:hypothetical protein O6P43_032848 [Quillaja saponaria]